MGIRSLAADLLPSGMSLGMGRASAAAKAAATAAEPTETTTFDSLLRKLDYLGKADQRLVRDAYKFADEAHLGQMRDSGLPYITHPLAVAGLCANWKLDAQAISAALMHDAMEDCGVTKPELIERFGAPTAEMVDGLTKLDKLQFSTREQSQAESFRKMLLAMSRDVRVILIKLADRLHNLRTMEVMSSERKARIARETMEIYAPIAHRLGLNNTYRELQERSFGLLHPWRHAVLSKALVKARGTRRDIVERMRVDVERAFGQQRLKARIAGREKMIHSIYRKMNDKRSTFAQVSDLFGFRIIVPTLTDCYVALGVLHQMYKPMPGRFKDFIAIPKNNGYQSLHTTLASPVGTAVEFQIRTEAMDTVAESGIAAHWMYKTKDANHVDEAQRLGSMWLRSLIDIQADTGDSAEFLEHVKIDLSPDAIYVFTPQNKILALPHGATPVDFAYAIHSDVGDQCAGARVNGESVALRTELRSGDVVEIVTTPTAKPNPGWLNFVRTGRARSKIRHHLKSVELEESRALGEKLLTQALRAEGMSMPPPENSGDEAAMLWQLITRWSGNRSRSELMGDVGMGRKIAHIVAKRIAQTMMEHGARPDAVMLTMGRYETSDHVPTQGLVTIDGSDRGTIQFATCCRPIPGDDVVGYLGRGEALVVHTVDCSVGKRMHERDSERWLAVDWSESLTGTFESMVHLTLKNVVGSLATVAQAVGSAEADVTHIDMDEARGSDTVQVRLKLAVRDRQHMADVLRNLKRVPQVLQVARPKG
jgi:GTP diphosphokinase / guanosine-3',5'-bis(diphosphate) 3'-diphosphatase